jgi:hypothetical protein
VPRPRIARLVRRARPVHPVRASRPIRPVRAVRQVQTRKRLKIAWELAVCLQQSPKRQRQSDAHQSDPSGLTMWSVHPIRPFDSRSPSCPLGRSPAAGRPKKKMRGRSVVCISPCGSHACPLPCPAPKLSVRVCLRHRATPSERSEIRRANPPPPEFRHKGGEEEFALRNLRVFYVAISGHFHIFCTTAMAMTYPALPCRALPCPHT